MKPKRNMLAKLMGMMLAVTFTILSIGQAKPVYAVDTSTQLSVSIGTAMGRPGDTVEVPINVANVPTAGINNFNFAITYDTSALDLVNKTDTNGQVITDGDLPIIDVDMANTVIPAVADFSCSQLNDGMLDFLYEDNTEGSNPIKNSGTLFTLKFKIRDTAQPGDYAVNQVDYSESSYLGTMFSINDSLSSTGLTNVIPVFSAGKVTVSSDAIVPELLPSVGSVTENSNFDQIVQIRINGTGDFASSLSPANITLGGDFQGLTVISASQDSTSTFKANIELKGELKYTTGTGTITVDAAGWSGLCVPCGLTASINVIKAGTALAVVSSTPSANAKNVAVDSAITVKFNQGIKEGSTYSNITLSENSTSAGVTIANSISNDTLTITPTAKLKNNTTYTVSIPAGAISSTTGTPLASDYSFSFTTADSSSNSMGITIGSIYGEKNSQVNVPIILSNIPSSGLQAVGIVIQYDTNAFSTTLDDIIPNPDLINNPDKDFTTILDPANGKITIAFADDTAGTRTIMQNGVLANIKFNISNDSTVKVKDYTINIVEQDGVTDGKFNEIGNSVTLNNGVITVIVMGDVNGDGAVTLTDYQLVKRYVLYKTKGSYNCFDICSNVNKDSGTTLTDCQLIKRFILYGTAMHN